MAASQAVAAGLALFRVNLLGTALAFFVRLARIHDLAELI
jgi:hypothetical protein